jgi:ribosomal protein L14E/L6E/L27E
MSSFHPLLPGVGPVWGRIGGHLTVPVIDRRKFKAVNNRGRNFTDRKLKRVLRDIDNKIDAYLQELDDNDAKEPEERKITAEELKQKIKTLQERMKKYKDFRKQMEESGEIQISLTRRSMPVGGGRTTDVAYNVQMSVDEKHKMIVDHEVTNEVTDRSLLSQMSERAKEALGVEELDVLADMGYYDGQQVKECIEEGIHPTFPRQTPPPIASLASLPRMISGTILSKTATGVPLARS